MTDLDSAAEPAQALPAPDHPAYDLLIVGGGVNGSGIARDAVGRGLSVLLCEAGDLAQGTSSASSKLIHGGLRYLEQFQFRLVREALAEREVLLHNAPHIVWPMRFVLPHTRGLRPAWMLRLGLFLYDRLGGRGRSLPDSRSVQLEIAPEGEPLQPEIRRGFIYSDCWVDDSRLVLLNARDAADRGADIRVGTRCIQAERSAGAWLVTLEEVAGGARHTVRARALVNAAGPWVGEVLLRGLGRTKPPPLRLVKGSHILVPKLYEGDQAFVLQNHDGRIIFVIPYQDRFSLIGTTDIPFEGDPAEVAISPEETAYLCAVVNRHFYKHLRTDEVLHSYSGVRPLFDDQAASPSAITRDYVFDIEAGEDGGDDGGPRTAAPLLSIYGGKITTYRKLAEHALAKLAPFLPDMRPAWTAAAPLPGGDFPGGSFDRFLGGLRATYPFLPEALAHRYARLYGTLCQQFLKDAIRIEDLGEAFGAGLYEAEVAYLCEREWARSADDILWRRTKLGLHMTEDQQLRLRHRMLGRVPADRPTPTVIAAGAG